MLLLNFAFFIRRQLHNLGLNESTGSNVVLHLKDEMAFFSEVVHGHGTRHVGLPVVPLERALHFELIHHFVSKIDCVLVWLLLLLVADRVDHGPRAETVYL